MSELPVLMSFSGGRSSALAMKMLCKNGVPDNMVVVFANTGKERDETLDFINECSIRWDIPVVWIEGIYGPYNMEIETMKSSIGFRQVTYETAKRRTDPDTPFQKMIEWINCAIVPNRVSRFCTQYLKLIPLELYMHSLELYEYDTIMGIRYDEPKRVKKHKDAILPLDTHKITEPMVREHWANEPFDLHLKDYEGNCDFCHLKAFKKRLTIAKENPEIPIWWANMEDATESEFQLDMPVSKIIDMSQNKAFIKAIDLLEKSTNAPQLFGGDFDIECYCGD